MNINKRIPALIILFLIVFSLAGARTAFCEWKMIDFYNGGPLPNYTTQCSYYFITGWLWGNECGDTNPPIYDYFYNDGEIRIAYWNHNGICHGGTPRFLGGCEPETYYGSGGEPGVTFTLQRTIEVNMPNMDVVGPDAADEKGICPVNIKKAKDTVSNPINILSGSKEEFVTDLIFNSPFEKGFTFYRTYDSRILVDSTIGFGWHHNYNVTLKYYQNMILLKDESYRLDLFRDEDDDGTFTADVEAVGYITTEADGSFIWHRGNGIQYTFNDQYQFVAKTDGHGNVQNLTYDGDGRLDTVTDEATARTITFVYNGEGKIDHITGPVTNAVPNGIWVRFEYDGNSNLTRVEYADNNNGSAPSGFEYRYEDTQDPNNITEKRNLAGEFLSSWQYGHSYQPYFGGSDYAYASTTRDGKGVHIQYPSNATGELLVTDDFGVQKTYDIRKSDGKKRISTITGDGGCSSCSGNVVGYGYDGQKRVTRIEYANGRIDRFQDFNQRNQYQTEIRAAGTGDERTITYTLHPDTGERLSITEASVLGAGDKVTIFDYDDDGNATPNENPTHLMHRKIERGFTFNSAGDVTSYEYITTVDYNAKGQPTAIDGPLPGVQDKILLGYDPVSGDLLSRTLPLSGTTSFTYDAAGNVETITDANNITTTITYDGHNRPLSVTRNGVTTSLTYTAAGEPDTVTDALNRVLDYVYNPAGFLEKIVDPKGNYTFNGYNTLGQIIESSIHGADGTETQFSGIDYGDPANNPDLLSGKPWKTIRRNADDTANLETVYAYDAMGNLKAVTDANTNTAAYAYDLFDRLEQVTQTGDVTTFYRYDLHGNLKSITDAENHATLYTYDDMGRLVQTDSVDTGITAYAYDAAGDLRYKTQNDKTTEYQYDGQSRLTHILYTDAAMNVTMTYDSAAEGANLKGRLTSVADPSGFVQYSYDDNGNVEMETRTVNGVAFVTGYGYDDAGNLRSIAYPSGHTVVYQPDATDPALIEGVSLDGAALAANITYAPFGPVTSMTLGNGIQVTRTYDKNYQVRTMTAGTVMDRAYTPDAVGNIELITDNLDSARSQSFDYDDLYRLTNASGIYGTTGYTYDKVGNRLTYTRTGSSPAQDSYHYMPQTNLLQTVEGTHSELFQYDADGNTTVRTPGANNPVPSITDPADYTYNAGGQRLLKQNTSDRIFHYDLDGRLIEETDGQGNLIKAYIWLHGQPLARFDAGGAIYYYHNDHLDTPQRMTDSGGSVVWAADYLPFGKAEVTVETVVNDLRFAGQYYDHETGLHYNGYRYYDPSLGRYLRADPIGLDGGINLYAYVQNNPLNAIDPYGLELRFAPGSSAAFKNQFKEIVDYLNSNGVSGQVAKLHARPEIVYIKEASSTHEFYYEHGTRTIVFDPLSGLEVAAGSVQTPALGVLHEVAHALQHLKNPTKFTADCGTADPDYDTAEERRAIMKIETWAANKIGEPTRTNHGGTPVIVSCPTCDH